MMLKVVTTSDASKSKSLLTTHEQSCVHTISEQTGLRIVIRNEQLTVPAQSSCCWDTPARFVDGVLQLYDGLTRDATRT